MRMISSKLVVRYADGRVEKGTSNDLFPNKETFHLVDWKSQERNEVRLEDLKAVFFVKDLDGDPSRRRSRRYELERAGLGRRIQVRFHDGETIEGYTSGYSADRLAFFLFPPDPEDNTERMLVVNRATREVNLV